MESTVSEDLETNWSPLCPHFKPPGWDNRSGVIAAAPAPKTVKKTNPRKPTSPQSERAEGRYVLDPSKPLTERQQLKLLGVTDITGQDQGPKCKDDNDRILLNVRLMSGSDESGAVRFRLSAKSKLKKLMRSYSEYMGLEEHKVVSRRRRRPLSPFLILACRRRQQLTVRMTKTAEVFLFGRWAEPVAHTHSTRTARG